MRAGSVGGEVEHPSLGHHIPQGRGAPTGLTEQAYFCISP